MSRTTLYCTMQPDVEAKGGWQMIRPIGLIEADDREVCRTVRQNATVAGYLHALALLCVECADNPELLADFLAIIALVPATLIELARERRRIAA